MNRQILPLVIFLFAATWCGWPPVACSAEIEDVHDLRFSSLPRVWDEGLPLGNGIIGSLIWQRGNVLRMALDRADLWDLRSIKEFEGPEFRFAWVVSHVLRGDYGPVHTMGDVPYDRDPAPTKLPGAALEFAIPGVGDIAEALVRLKEAVCDIDWKSGIHMQAFIHETEPRGWFMLTGAIGKLRPVLVPPPYGSKSVAASAEDSGASGNGLRRLKYPGPQVSEGASEILYHQTGYGGFSYDVWVGWSHSADGTLIGCWTIRPNRPYALSASTSSPSLQDVTGSSYLREYLSHCAWWQKFWDRSSVTLPDPMLEKQWCLEQYKFGSAARRGAPPISLQAVWTADNGRLPPWKGDFHNDLNTELSYWPAYSSNHLEEETAFLDWLWLCKPVSEKWTRTYFGTHGLNVPGVATLLGEPMGGWIQYSLSPTTGAWLAQHFYLHWKYSMDREFLKERTYPWLSSVANHIQQISVVDASGMRSLPLSSSPEINDNRITAWFRQTTNYDLALIRWLFGAAEELARELGLGRDAERWRKAAAEWPTLAVANDGRLLVAPGVPLRESHRHFSHLMAIHPLGLLDWDREADRRTIAASLADLEHLGPDWWCGYSYSWLGNLWARARDGDKAAAALRTFATSFCLPNSFHANGDQSKTGKSKFTYRPFTLEGNFAFAAGIQEMLLQSQGGVVRIFPAIPSAWQNVGFTQLRAEGAFLVSASLKEGKLDSLQIMSEKGGKLRMQNPFRGDTVSVQGASISRAALAAAVIEIDTLPGSTILFTRRSP
ncbi:MAG TPA: hypothetical protein VE398_21310 [Acidobacteriota bacterium]|nr:hypothetical protein [Acidobacteriota bacterium]